MTTKQQQFKIDYNKSDYLLLKKQYNFILIIDGRYANDEHHETNRSQIDDDKAGAQEQQQNQSYMITYTQGNMTTNTNNLSVSKIDLNQIQGRYKSANIKNQDGQEFVIEPCDLENICDQKDVDQVDQVIPLEIQQELNFHGNQDDRKSKQNKKNNKSPSYKKKQRGLEIDIPTSEDDRKARLAAYNKKMEEQNKQQTSGSTKNQKRGSQSSSQTKDSESRNQEGMEPQESTRVNDIIKNNQMDVENLETIQIDYDFETIEGLTDDQCLELYCEGSVKLKNQSRLYCKLAFESLLIDKIRSTTRLVYSNLGIKNNGNLNSKDFIQDYIVQQLKNDNSKFRASDISEAFTVQCSDYIHFNIRKNIRQSVRLFILLSLISLASFFLKISDSSYEKDISVQCCFIITCFIQIISSYFYLSAAYACSNSNFRKAMFINKIFFFANIVDQIYEDITLQYFHQLVQNTLYQRDNFKQVLFYYFSFLISIIIPPYLHTINKNTTNAVRRIVKIVSDEFFD